jgi:hypothetical protein
MLTSWHSFGSRQLLFGGSSLPALTDTVVCKIEQLARLENEKLSGYVQETPMRKTISVITTMLAAVLMLLFPNGFAQTPPMGSTLTIAGHSAEAHLLQVHGKSYIDIETLARLTQGTLSYKSSHTILTLPPSDRDVPAPAPHVNAGFSIPLLKGLWIP